jgi:hypothetical protein
MGPSGSFKEFASIAAASSFLLFRGPEGVSRVVRDALDQCGVAYSLIRGTDAPRDKICFRLGDSFVICRAAYAVFDE